MSVSKNFMKVSTWFPCVTNVSKLGPWVDCAWEHVFSCRRVHVVPRGKRLSCHVFAGKVLNYHWGRNHGRYGWIHVVLDSK